MSLSPTGHETDMADMLHLLNNNSLIEISVLVLSGVFHREIDFFLPKGNNPALQICLLT